MDKVYHFKGKSAAQGHLKHIAEGTAGFYSEEEVEDSPGSIKPEQAPKKSTFNTSNFSLDENPNCTIILYSENQQLYEHQQVIIQRKKTFCDVCLSFLKKVLIIVSKAKNRPEVEGIQVRPPSQTVGYTKPTHLHSNSYSSNIKTVDGKSKLLFNLQGQQGVADSDNDARRIIKKTEIFDALQSHPFRHLIFSSTVNEGAFRKHLTLTYRGLVYARKCLKGPSEKFIKSKQVSVPESKIPKGKTLLLDLDETLIHSCSLKENPEHIIKAKSDPDDKIGYQIGLRVRPFCMEFLQKLSQLWDIYIFTASSPTYASAIVKFLDPEGKYINGILNRLNCMETKNGFFIKDLRIVKGKDLKKTIIVDNLAHSFGFQIENGVPILEWHQDKNDQELKNLIPYLIEAANAEDVKQFNSDRLRLIELSDSNVDDI